jgi:hypothetical protein
LLMLVRQCSVTDADLEPCGPPCQQPQHNV